MVLAGAALASAKTASRGTTPPLTIGRPHSGYTVNAQLLVDSKGTVNAVWKGVRGTHFLVDYARKTVKAKSFSHVALPDAENAAASNDSPVIWAPSRGVLEIFDGDFDSGFDAWRSTDDGKSWKSMNTSALNALDPQGVYVSSSGMFPAPGGPLFFAGTDGDTTAPIAQLKADLSGITKVATIPIAVSSPEMAKALDGTPYLFGTVGSVMTYQAGTHTGSVTFPCASGFGSMPGGATHETLAAGRSIAVVAFAGCGHVWIRTITPTGVLGPLTKIGTGPKPVSSSGTVSSPGSWVAVSADSKGNFTAAFAVGGEDLGVAHSSDGVHWKLAPGLVPTAGGVLSPTEATGTLSAGTTSWYSSGGGGISLTDTYKPPAVPSAAGIADPLAGRIGSLAAVVPRVLPLSTWHKTGLTSIKVVDAIAGPVTVSLLDDRVTGENTTDVCDGTSKPTRLAPDQVQTIKLSCGSSAVTIGGSGTASTEIAADKGDLVTFTITDRMQVLTLTSHVK